MPGINPTYDELLQENLLLKQQIAASNIPLSVNKFSIVIEQSPASVVITDTDGNIEYVNTKFTEVTGYTYAESIGKNPRILKSGLMPASTYSELWQTILSGEVWKGEITNRNKSGEIYWEKVLIAPIKNETGKITNFVSVKENITDRKMAEFEIKASQDRYKFFSDITTTGIIIHDNLKIIDINKSATRLTGFNDFELLEKELLSELFTEDSFLTLMQFVKEENTNPFEAKGVRKDGSFYNVEVETRKYFLQNKQIQVTALRDITLRKRFENVLQSSLKLIEYANIHDVDQIIKWGLEEAVKLSDSKIGFFHFVNDDQKTISLHVWTDDTIKNCNVPESKLHYPIEEAGTWVDSFHERKAIIHNDYQNINHKKGLPHGHFPLIRYISLPIIENDLVKVIFGIGNKKVEYTQIDLDVLSSFAENLWSAIQRKRTEKKLVEANSSKDKFFSIISHDLRSPLGSIQSLTEIILENFNDLKSEELQLYLKTINETSTATYSLLDNMLIWAQTQRKKVEFFPISIPLQELIKGVVNIYQYKADTKGISIAFELGESILIKADPNMLETILRNLLSNAIKFTSQNGKISIKAIPYNNNFVKIVVSDTGIGIPESKLLKIFSVDENLSTRGTANEKGTGLGLVICKEFVEINGGNIWVESKEQKGTDFIFTIPIASKN